MATYPVPIFEGDRNPCESAEWLESLEFALEDGGADRVRFLFEMLAQHAHRRGVELPFTATTPYINTIPLDQQPAYPGNRELERRIKSIIRWNAMAMVVRANRETAGIGGHISTFASAATLYEVAFNHFFRGPKEGFAGDQVYFQGHASPGIYSRAFLEGRLDEQQLINFRRELQETRGLSSYPHPWLMPDFWQFPTVSMGLAPIMAIYQARFNRYLKDRGINEAAEDVNVWAFLGDGETDEPETLGAITLASREKLDNLTFVINCNLQRLDGPVRGNGKIVQELEGAFRGAGWNVIKVLWGSDWDPLIESEQGDLLAKRMMEVVDGEYQKYTVSSGQYIREHFFGRSPELLELVKNHSDEQLRKMRRGGHDPEKVYAAYKRAMETKGRPTVILAQTIKGYGLGESGEGRNVTHQQKKLNEEELREFRTRFNIPISDEDVSQAPFYRPAEDSPEMEYLRQRREALGGALPSRSESAPALETPSLTDYKEFAEGSGGREVSTTMAFVRLFGKVLRDKNVGKYLVPIVPDESRTFGMEALFRQCGIYAHTGQLYEPVDSDTMLYYREAKDGQILEEGITEAGSMASFNAAGTAYSSHGVPMIPVFIYYSMFGFQRVADLIWAACDMRAKGFMIGGTAGRTTLNGEGLQHEDGHSHLFSSAFPTIRSYDPAFGYEVAVIFLEGMKRLYQDQETAIYYLTVENENYEQPPMPEGAQEGILKGLYKYKSFDADGKLKVNLLGSGAILRMVLSAAEILSEKYSVACDVYSATSYTQIRRDCQEAERWNRLHPEQEQKTSYLQQLLEGCDGPFVAASDYVKAVPEQVSRWVPGGLTALGTDGFGRSESRKALRRFFEVDAESIVVAALHELAGQGKIEMSKVAEAIKELDMDPDKPNPLNT